MEMLQVASMVQRRCR